MEFPMSRLTDPPEEGQPDRRRFMRRRSDASAVQILERITDEFTALDREWRLTYINEASLDGLRRATGKHVTREDVLGKNIWEMYPAFLGSVAAQVYHNAMREQKTITFDTHSPVTDRWLEGRVYPSEDGVSVYIRDATDRREVVEQLRYHAYLLENVHDAVIATDARLHVTAWNKGAEQMYGWRADEVLGRHIWEAVPVDLDDERRAEALRELAEKGRYRVEAVTYGKGGAPVYVEGITIALRGENKDGPLTGYVNIRRDVTERQRAETARREANERIELFLESITDRFFAIDKEWRYAYFNSGAKEQLRALGKDPEALIGKVLWEEFPTPTSEAELRRAMRDRVVATVERFSPRIGEWYENRIYPSPDGGLAVFQSDVTPKKRAEEKLRRSEGYLTEGQRLTHTGSWAWNLSSGELFWSKEHFRICGLDPEKDTPSYPSMHWIHPDDRTMVHETFEKAIRDRTDFELDCRVVWTDGTSRYVHSFAHPVFNDAGDLIEYVGTILDTTERKLAEDVRNELMRRLFAAQEDERRRISRDLHDDFGQHVSALGLRLTALKGEHGGSENLALQVASLEAIVKQLGSAVELIAWQLRPAALDDFGLGAGLTSYAERWSAHVDVGTELHVSGIEANLLTNDCEIALYRIAQEALNNVAKHARARNVVILLQHRSDQVWLIVEDDGVGFDTAEIFAALGKRLGVVGMRERASLLGGTLDVESNLGHGTTVVARLPATPS
jgi:PAS domain S-box-containing protein